MKIPSYLKKVSEPIYSKNVIKKRLTLFEDRVKLLYEDAEITAPIHLSKGNEDELIEIFEYVHPDDWVFSSWRNHYHALLHGVDEKELLKDIVDGRSMSTNYINPKFYS